MKKENKQAMGGMVGGLLGLAAVAAADKLIGFDGLISHWLQLVILGVCVMLGWFLGQKIATKLGTES